ncbi:MAG: T9SS type A sorting domain-containing protein [Candidatus Marinimicrobia bacterium]|nr:T9SS type A sorting domain-containing protein [Candidatus Neomarinimicrobiota bacterium]MCF7904689.1 T9SS type A sorting domain-containing protein [Candidatus Neomarinimicrobiota bacterium]
MQAEVKETSINPYPTKHTFIVNDNPAVLNNGLLIMDSLRIRLVFHNTTVGTVDQIKLPNSYGVDSAFPNPFNNQTTISIATPEICDIHLEVYNLLGQHIWSREFEQLFPGNHKISWDGTNMHGEYVDSGVYVILASSSGWSESIRVALLK